MKKARRTVQSKSRILRPDLGVSNDALYYASSGSMHGGNMQPQTVREQYIRSLYMSGKANRKTLSTPDTSSWPYGSEQFNGSAVNVRTRWSNCVHLSQRAMQHPYGRIVLAWNSLPGPYGTEYVEPYWRKSPSGLSYWRDAANVALSHSLSDEQFFSARAYWSMRPKFKANVSLINSIFELKDFSDIAKYLFSPSGLMRAAVKAAKPLKRFAKHAISTNKNAWSKYRAERLAAVKNRTGEAFTWLSRPGAAVEDVLAVSTKAAATGVLTYNLAIMPTLQDAMAIHAAAQLDVYEKARQFSKFGEEGARSHYSEETVLFNSITTGTHNNSLWGSGKYVWQKRSAMMVSYYRTLWQNLEDRYPYWWGLEIGADEIWNMLPLSFVLDYFLTVGKSLEYMDIDKSVDIHHVDYLESVKTLATSGIHYLHNARTSHLMINDNYYKPRSKDTFLLVTGTMGKYYKRQIKVPYKGPALPKIKAPSVTQAVNLAALVRCLTF